MTIHSLGYLGVITQDLEAWRAFGTDVLGLQDVSNSDTEAKSVSLKMDDAPWRLLIESGDADQLALCGWEVVSEAALHALSEKLTEAGTAWSWASD